MFHTHTVPFWHRNVNLENASILPPPLKNPCGRNAGTFIFGDANFLPFGVAHGIFLPMENIIAVDRFGRLVIPGHLRKALHVSSPAAFKAAAMGNKVELTVIAPEGGRVVKKRRGLLLISAGGKKFNAAEAVRVVREEQS